MNIQILKKDSHKAFCYLAGINRPISPSHVTKLANSIDKMNIIRPVVVADLSFITGKKQTYIIDGQHLFNALLRKNVDIPYIKIEIKDQRELVEKIALLNASSKSWAVVDYIIAWGSLSADYKKLNHYFNVYDIELMTIAGTLSGGNSITGGSISGVIKNGNFKIKNETENVKILDYLTDLLKIIPRMGRIENRYVCSEFIKMYRANSIAYNHIKFLKALEKHKERFILVTQEPDKLSSLLESLI